MERWSTFSIISMIGVPVVTGPPVRSSSNTPGQDLHLVRFLALRGEARLAGPPLVEEALDVFGRQRNVGRAAIDDAADGRAMAFAEGGDAEQMAECIVGHGASN